MKKIVFRIVIGLVIFLTAAAVVRQAVNTVKAGAMAYLFCYPLVLMDATEETTIKGAAEADFNQFMHVRYLPDHTFRNVVRPNRDTLYSTAWLNLEKAPQIVSVPDAGDRYYVLPLMDTWTNVFARIGTSSTGNRQDDFAILGPEWKGPLPKGMETIVSPTNRVWIIGRIQSDGKKDFPAVFKLQDQLRITPLSGWPEKKANPEHIRKPQDGRNANISPMAVLEKYSDEAFFNKAASRMASQPPFDRDKPMLASLRDFGIVPGKPFDPERLNPVKRRLLAAGVEKAKEKMENIAAEDRGGENGWKVIREGIGNYGTDYGLRAVVAKIGLGALPPQEAAYPNAPVDGEGSPLNGEDLYKIHFPEGQAPPVNAFWSLTMYDKQGFLVKNPIGRYKISSTDKPAFNKDGSLDIYISHKKPGQKDANWLPAPDGPFELTLRMYLPQIGFLDGTWQVPPIEKID